MTAGMPGEQHASAGKCCPRAEEFQAGMEGRLFLPGNILGSLFPGAQIIDAHAGSDDNADRNKEDIGNHGTGASITQLWAPARILRPVEGALTIFTAATVGEAFSFLFQCRRGTVI